MKLFGALDLGGTLLKTALVDEAGSIAESDFTGIESIAFDAEKLSGLIARRISALHGNGASAITVAVPFAVDHAEEIHYASNISSELSPGRVRKLLIDSYRIEPSLSFINDVKAAALGELSRGALMGHGECGIFVNIGTGLSMASVINNMVLSGSRGYAGELAFCVSGTDELDNRPEGIFPLEGRISGKVLSALLSTAGGDGGPITLEDVFSQDGAGQFDRSSARRSIRESFKHLAMHLINICHLLNPSAIVFGGGVSRDFNHFAPFVRDYLQRHTLDMPELLPGKLDKFAGLIGAAHWAKFMQEGGVNAKP